MQKETDLCYRVEHAGGGIHYVPYAVVDHWIFPERLEPAWFLKRFWLHGRSNAFVEQRNRGVRRAFGVWRWHYMRRLTAAASRRRAGSRSARARSLSSCCYLTTLENWWD